MPLERKLLLRPKIHSVFNQPSILGDLLPHIQNQVNEGGTEICVAHSDFSRPRVCKGCELFETNDQSPLRDGSTLDVTRFA